MGFELWSGGAIWYVCILVQHMSGRARSTDVSYRCAADIRGFTRPGRRECGERTVKSKFGARHGAVQLNG